MTDPIDRTAPPFWRRKTLRQMTTDEWESLCDGCGKCCLHKVRQRDGRVSITNVACRLLDVNTCRCGNYPARKRLVPDCVVLTPETVGTLDWLPSTCAYRLVHAGADLPAWHPLRTGSAAAMHAAGISVRGRAVSERGAGRLDTHIVTWPDF
ncbi:MAG: YcgN family cysteine cluster protein [Rhodospirillaceae bacterium]|nr:YcgN family cysteine cluster protein [Rhodospirillaceae bacterium]